MKVVSYYSSIPAGNKNPEKEQILKNFSAGVKRYGDDIIEHHGNYMMSDVALIQGWVHETSANSPHLNVRKQVIHNQTALNKCVITADSNLFLYAVGKENEPHHYLRYSANGIFPTTGKYFWDNPNPDRWKQISRDLNINLKDWRTNGNHILITTQRNGGWSMGGTSVVDWVNHTIKKLRKHTDRPIIIRGHPGDAKAKVYLKNKEWSLSKNLNLLDDLKNCWAVITYNSSPGVASAIEGIPVFVTDPMPYKSQAFDIANFDYKLIESPNMPDRQTWIEKISMCHWNFEELASGEAWNHIRQYCT